ncbi:uncharacterized protein DUF4105, partial [Phyllobacterium brassicacearum]
DFEWRSKTDFTERWATRTYDLTKLQTVDLFMSYWGNPNIAHVMLSFGFEGGDYIAWSIEVRRRIGGEFSPVADLFKSDPLVIIASDERDVVGVRSNFRQLKQIVNERSQCAIWTTSRGVVRRHRWIANCLRRQRCFRRACGRASLLFQPWVPMRPIAASCLMQVFRCTACQVCLLRPPTTVPMA